MNFIFFIAANNNKSSGKSIYVKADVTWLLGFQI